MYVLISSFLFFLCSGILNRMSGSSVENVSKRMNVFACFTFYFGSFECKWIYGRDIFQFQITFAPLTVTFYFQSANANWKFVSNFEWNLLTVYETILLNILNFIDTAKYFAVIFFFSVKFLSINIPKISLTTCDLIIEIC